VLGSSEQSGNGRLVFPIVASLLVFIALVFLVSSKNDASNVEKIKTRTSKSASKSTTMRIADKVIVPLTLMTMPLRGGEKMVEDVRQRSEVFEENKRLKTLVAQLSDSQMRANALAMKIKRFENLLSADAGIDIPVKKIAGRIVSEHNGPFARSALLNVGAVSGVRVGHSVMTENGLYGHVVAIGNRSSRVLLLQDINSRIAVMSPRSEARAIMIGSNVEQPTLSFVARDADWQDGDTIVTSGDEGVLPRGLPVGVVKQRGPEKRNVILDTVGRPVDWVWVYPYTPVKAPEEDLVVEEVVQNVSETPLGLLDDEVTVPGSERLPSGEQ